MKQQGPPQANMKLGLLYAVLAAWVYTTLSVVAKFGSLTLSNSMMVWARQLFGLCTIAPILLGECRRHGVRYLGTDYPKLHIFRTLTSLGSGYCLFFALSLLPLAEAVVLSYTRSLFVPLYAALFLHKRIEGIIWAGLVTGFVGVALIINPGSALLELPSLVGLASGAIGGAAFLAIRRLNKVEPANRITWYYFLLSTLLASLPLFWVWETPDSGAWLLLIAIGALAALYQYCLTRAYRYARASIIGGVLQVALIFSLAYDWIFFGIPPGGIALLGMLLIAGSSVIVVVASQRARP